ncbi:MAG: hypothetical protein J6D21_01565 [Clostridia bacterium]|nr:hypothetical protein [Clostridia bacterium]
MEGVSTGLVGFFEAIGNGLKTLLPDVATSTVTTVDTLIYTADGTLTTLSQLGIVGIVCGAGFCIWRIAKRKAAKHF